MGCGARFGAPAGDGGVTAIPAAAVADAASPVAGGAAAPVAGGRVGGSIASVDGETGTAEDSCGRPEGAELIAF